MPAISMFYGRIVQMMFFDTDKHKKPHIHVRYGEVKASIDIETIEIIAGNLPTKQLRRKGIDGNS